MIKEIFLIGAILAMAVCTTFLAISYTIDSTILNPAFVVSEAEKANAYATARELLVAGMSGEIKDASMIALINRSITPHWLKTHADGVVYQSLDYINSQNGQLEIEISTIELKSNLKANLREAAGGVPVESLGGIDKKIDDEVEDVVNLADYEGVAAVMSSVRDQVQMYRSAKLVVFAVLVILALFIFILLRSAWKFAAALGAVLLVSAALIHIALFSAAAGVEKVSGALDIPSEILAVLSLMITDCLAVLSGCRTALLATAILLILIGLGMQFLPKFILKKKWKTKG